MPTENLERDTPDQPTRSGPGTTATPDDALGVGGPVGVVGQGETPAVRPAPDHDQDPAEAEFERLTGHRTDERPTSRDDRERGSNR